MKSKLRKKMRELERKRSGTLLKLNADIAIRDSLRSLEQLKNAECVAGYIPKSGEVDLTPLLAIIAESGTRVCLPRGSCGKSAVLDTNDDAADPRKLRIGVKDLAYVMAEVGSEVFSSSAKENVLLEGVFGISEPNSTARVVPNSEVDVWLVPALAFDDLGNRLGRGGGFYDRFLAKSAGVRIGVGYDSMILKELPCDEWDQSMDLIVTERRLLWM